MNCSNDIYDIKLQCCLCFRIYNYSKNPTRGARDFTVEVDDRMLYMGVIEAALDDSKYSNTLNDSKNTMGACTILFTNDPKIVKSEKDKVQLKLLNALHMLEWF